MYYKNNISKEKSQITALYKVILRFKRLYLSKLSSYYKKYNKRKHIKQFGAKYDVKINKHKKKFNKFVRFSQKRQLFNLQNFKKYVVGSRSKRKKMLYYKHFLRTQSVSKKGRQKFIGFFLKKFLLNN
jgi:hypothetical protein